MYFKAVGIVIEKVTFSIKKTFLFSYIFHYFVLQILIFIFEIITILKIKFVLTN